jgi:hypothetical protein
MKIEIENQQPIDTPDFPMRSIGQGKLIEAHLSDGTIMRGYAYRVLARSISFLGDPRILLAADVVRLVVGWPAARESQAQHEHEA